MKTPDEITEMIGCLEEDIRSTGWDAAIDGVVTALHWVLGDISPLGTDTAMRRLLDRPEGDRRRDWIVAGGEPEDWPA